MTALAALRSGPRPALRPAHLTRFLAAALTHIGLGYGLYALALRAGLPAQAALIMPAALGLLWLSSPPARRARTRRGWRRPASIGSALAIWALNAGALHALLAQGFGALAAQALLLPFTALLLWLLIGHMTGPYRPRKGGL